MNIEELRSLVENRRRIRGYDEGRDIPDEMIEGILDCARRAPSGGNGLPWEFIIVRNRETRYKIADCYLKQLEQKREMDLAVGGTADITGELGEGALIRQFRVSNLGLSRDPRRETQNSL